MAKKSSGTEIPKWMTTFADLMALMMTFFVLLYSFSTIEEKKFKMIASSMAEGFGSSVVHFTEQANSAPGAPTFTPLMPSASRSSSRTEAERKAEATQDLLVQLQDSMHKEIEEGLINIESQGNSVVVRLPEEIAFPSGSDELSGDILPVIAEVGKALRNAPGLIMISGHTDNQPISSSRFRSNWGLSTDRAVSVVQQLIALGGIDPERLSAIGYADTRPIVPNDTPEHRAKNRRVEISIATE